MRRPASRVAAVLLGVGLVVGACNAPPQDPPEVPAEVAPPPELAEPPGEPPGDTSREAAEPPPPVDEPPPPLLGSYGVSAGDPAAVAAGMQVLENGGNAVDAAVATAFAVAVVEPFASGIGGGGAAIVAGPNLPPVAFDYREVVAEDGIIPASNTGVPGFVAGMARLLEEQGSRPLAEVLGPAIQLADEATTSDTLATQLRSGAGRLPVGRLPHLYPGGAPLDAGAPLVQEELAATLRQLAADGPVSFYEGALADVLDAQVAGIDRASLAAYEVQVSRPPQGQVGDYQVVGAAPPLPGASLIQLLQVAEALGVADQPPGSADLVHSIAMSWRLADQHISWELGDPDFVDVPLDDLTDAHRNAALAAAIPADALLPVDPTTPPDAETGNTTHLTVVDQDGLAVSMTNTLTNFWGAGTYVQGFFLNDQLRRFSIGRGSANQPEAGRRSVSWSLPAMVLDDRGRPVLGLGSPGGRRIPTILAQVLAGWMFHGQSLEEAVSAERFHLEGSELLFEQLPPTEVAQDLRGRGYASLSVPAPPLYFGSVQALEVRYEAGEVIGARDTRREADVATVSSTSR